MSVQFNENNFAQTPQYGGYDEPAGISGKLISWGIAKDKKTANIMLLAGLAFFILLIIVIIASSSGDTVYNTENPPTPYEEGVRI